jgi:hypothetical protein
VTIEIRSYRSVFDLERRIYRVDRLRLNPGGVPVRGVVYCLAIVAMMLIAGCVPVLALAVRALPWYLRDVALPAVGAAVLGVIRVEGRPFHLAAQALLRYRSELRTGVGAHQWGAGSTSIAPGGRWRMGDVLVLPDGSDGRLRRLRYTGPGAVLVAVAHERVDGRRWRPRVALTLRPAAGSDDPSTGGHEPRSRGPASRDDALGSGRRGQGGRSQGAAGEGQVIGLAPGVRMLVRADPLLTGIAARREAQR